MSLICPALLDEEMLLKRMASTPTKKSIMIVTPDMATVTASPSSSSLAVEFVIAHGDEAKKTELVLVLRLLEVMGGGRWAVGGGRWAAGGGWWVREVELLFVLL